MLFYRISALSSCKRDKHGYMTGEEIMLPQQDRIIQEAKLSYLAQIKTYKTNKD